MHGFRGGRTLMRIFVGESDRWGDAGARSRDPVSPGGIPEDERAQHRSGGLEPPGSPTHE
jgi:hypothetical protein